MARFTGSLASRVMAVAMAAGVLAALQGCTVVQERRVYVPVPPPPQPDVFIAGGPQANPPAGAPAGPGVTIYSPPPEPVVVYQPQVVYEPAPVYVPEPVVTTYETTVIGGGFYHGSNYGARSFRDRRYPYRGGGYVHIGGHDDDRRGGGRDDHHDDRGGWNGGRDNDHGDHGGRDQGNHSGRGGDNNGGPRGQRDDRGSGQPTPRPTPPSRPEPPKQNPVAGPKPRPAPQPAPAQAAPRGGSPLLAQPARQTQQNRDQRKQDQDKGTSTRRGGSPLMPR